jgi:cytochrome c peroxidase
MESARERVRGRDRDVEGVDSMDGIKRRTFVGFLAAGLAFTAACSGRASRPDADLVLKARDAFGALPAVMASADNPVTPAKVALGKMLFYESRISADGTASCVRCHPLSLYAVDGLSKSVGNRCRPSGRNAPSVLNAAAQISVHWVGNRTSVEDQARQALVGAASFGMASYEAAESRLREIPGYAPLFKQAFPGEPEPITAANFALAVGAFERTLVTPAPFDRFLSGDGKALTDRQKSGLSDFLETGCANCHGGPFFGGRSYEKFGVLEPYGTYTKSAEIDEGRFGVTKSEADRYVFKVPVLRNAQMTGPYFHDGSVGSLSEAVRIMGKIQLGADLDGTRVEGIVLFLQALTGTIPTDTLEVPILPADEAGAAADPVPISPAGLSPNEDLMQEHALLERVLLIYEEVARRVESGAHPDPDVLGQAARTVRHFIEQYHEKLEEEHVFPRFDKAGPFGDLVRTLTAQHAAGRVLTERIIARSTPAAFRDPAERQKLVDDVQAFIRMYRPHAAREGSVLFPAFRGILPAKEFQELGDRFEAKEHELLGAEGFEGQVALVDGLEKRLGLGDLSRTTPGRRE